MHSCTCVRGPPATLHVSQQISSKLPLKRCRATGGCSSYTCGCRAALQPEIIAKLIPKTLFHVTEMRFSKKIVQKQVIHVILGITNEYVICNFREINSEEYFV